MKYLLLFIWLELIIVFASSCSLITPDRLGVGMTEGSMNAFGRSNKFMKNQPNAMEMDITGDTLGTMVWLEWDLNVEKGESDYDKYLQERIKTLNLEKELLLQERAIDRIIINIDKALDYEQECTPAEREVEGMWPKRLTTLYG
jgi:hypothetical protein